MKTRLRTIEALGVFLFPFVVLLQTASFGSQTSPPAAAPASEPRVVQPPFFAAPPKIDGRLDDSCWSLTPLEKEFTSYNPRYGDLLPQKTIVFVGYDQNAVYFAFRCLDPEPDKIKTSVARRDAIFSDDWIGLSIDSQGLRQCSYDLFVNPSGIQADIYDSTTGGEDSSTDFVWESAGRRTADGYEVEIAVPLRTLRFQSGKDVRMGILFWRKISRTGYSGSWPDLKPGVGLFNVMADLRFGELKAPLNLEALPSLTVANSRERLSPDAWGKRDSARSLGIGLKYGLTSSITVEATVNPDFSQVESDAFQVTVNQRYPIFYEEKRPFFMETSGLFNIAGTGGDGNMLTSFYSRRIVDPGWGTRLTGTAGQFTFAILGAGDDAAGREWEGTPDPRAGRAAGFVAGRGKFSLSGDSYVGVLYSGREFAGGFNRAGGVDVQLRPFPNHQLSLSALQTASEDPVSGARTGGASISALWDYMTKPLGAELWFEHFGTGFQMDSAFYSRVGFTRLTGYIGPNFFPKKPAWIKKVNPFFFGFLLHDLGTGLNERLGVFAVRTNFAKQSQLRLDAVLYREGWIDRTYDQLTFRMQGYLQLTNWLYFDGQVSSGDRIFYDSTNPFLGRMESARAGIVLQPGVKLSQSLSLSQNHFTRGGIPVYDVTVLNARTTYQFNKYLFVRALFQYDSYARKWLTDLLASFTYIPGTVVHLGYGVLYEKHGWEAGQWLPGGDLGARYYALKNSLFFKVSYLWRF
ncbi:MAG: DUF5916 domain-containing protein [Candidatus Aminicenantales bacterium]